MTREDKLEVIEIVVESVKITNKEISTEFNTNILKAMETQDKKLEKVVTMVIEAQDKKIETLLETQNKNHTKVIRAVLEEQTDRFTNSLKPYEKHLAKHERQFNNIKDALNEEEESDD